MTILSEDAFRQSLGDGVTTVFSTPALQKAEDLTVYLDDDIVSPASFVLTGVGNPAGASIAFTVAPALGVQVLRLRMPSATQSVVYKDGNRFPAASHEGALDRLETRVQALQYRLNRTVRLADHQPAVDPVASASVPVLTWSDSPLSVRAFGAVGDGTYAPAVGGTDDSAEFQAAIAAAVAKGGGTISVPSRGGNYRLSQDILLGNGADGSYSTWPSVTIEGLSPASGFGVNNPIGGGGLILDGAQIKAPGPQVSLGLRDLFLVTPASYPAGRWAVDLFETSYAQIDNLNFSLYAGNGLRFTGYGDNGNLFNSIGTVRFRMDPGVAASGSKAMELTQVGTDFDTASSTFGFVGILPGRPDQVGLTLGNCDTNYFGHVDLYPVGAQASTAVGATTNSAGYAQGATVITLAAAGTGTIVAGGCVQFGTDPNVYRVTAGDADVSNGGSITLAAPGLLVAIPAAPTAITICRSALALKLDFTIDPDYPQSNTIDHFDAFNNRIEAVGTPSQLAKNNPNVIGYFNQQGGTPIPTGVTGLVVNRRRLKEGVLYVSTTGNDQGAAGMSVAGALRTIQKAYDLAALYYDLEGDLTIKLSDGTYTAGLLANIRALGKKVIIQGNSASPGSVVLNVSGTDAIVADGCQIVVRDMLISGATNGLRSINGGRIEYANIVWGSIVGAHIFADGGTIEQTGASFINQNAAQHILVRNGQYVSALATTMLANVAFTNFAKASMGGLIRATGATYPLGAFAVTGQRYLAEYAGVIDTAGGGASFFPGNAAGGAATGYYV